MYVKDVKDGKRTYRHIFYHTFLNMVLFECNAIYVEDVVDRSNTPNGCNAIYVEDIEDVKDRSNTPKGCNAMYVGDVEDGKRTYTFWFITSLIFNRFSIRNFFEKLRLRAFQPYHQILCILKIITISDVSDINSTTALRCT